MQKVNKVKKGLDIPISGKPEQIIDDTFSRSITEVALIGTNFRGMKPIFLVEEGDQVKLGQKLFEDRKCPGYYYTSPGTGCVKAIHRGKKRTFLSLVIELSNDESRSYDKTIGNVDHLSPDKTKAILIDSGLWINIRVRPFAKVANPGTKPSSIFVNTMDSNPLASDPSIIIKRQAKEFQAGLKVIAKLTEGQVHLCKRPGTEVPCGESEKVVKHLFDGCHPVGLSGYHIHTIDPITDVAKKVWYLGYQEVIAIGSFFLTGHYPIYRYVALAGPQVKKPRVVKTRIGSNLSQLVDGELKEGENRVISGSVLAGLKADSPVNFLGYYDNIVSVVEEDRNRIFHGFVAPGFDKFSIKNIFASTLFPKKLFTFGTNLNGSHRNVVPIGSYEQVMPFDMIPTFLVRAILSQDTELGEKLGVLELDEEDVALCTFVCPGKNDIGKELVNLLELIEKEHL